MVSVTLFHDKECTPRGYSLIGHAGMAEEGRDIVCASLSLMAINTANALKQLTDADVSVVEDPEEPLLDVRISGEPDERAVTLLKAMELACRQLQEDPEYQPYFSLKREEIES